MTLEWLLDKTDSVVTQNYLQRTILSNFCTTRGECGVNMTRPFSTGGQGVWYLYMIYWMMSALVKISIVFNFPDKIVWKVVC